MQIGNSRRGRRMSAVSGRGGRVPVPILFPRAMASRPLPVENEKPGPASRPSGHNSPSTISRYYNIRADYAICITKVF